VKLLHAPTATANRPIMSALTSSIIVVIPVIVASTSHWSGDGMGWVRIPMAIRGFLVIVFNCLWNPNYWTYLKHLCTILIMNSPLNLC